MGEQGGQHRTDGHQHPHIGGQRAGQGDVLQQEIEGDAAQARRREPQLLPPPGQPEPPGVQQAEGRKAQGEAEEQHLHGPQAGQEHLRGDKGGAPDQDGQGCREVALDGLLWQDGSLISHGKSPGTDRASGR